MDSTGTQFAVETAPELKLVPAITPRQRWFELGLVILFAIAPITLSAIDVLLHYTTRSHIGLGIGVASRLLHEISSLLLIIYFLSRRGESLRAIGLGWRGTDLLKGFGLAFGALFLSAFVQSFVRAFTVAVTNHNPDVRDPRVIFAGISPALMVIYSLSAAVFEETIVRAFVTSELIALSWPVWVASLSSVLLQTSYHVYYGLGGALTTSGMFIVFAIYFAKSRRLLPTILAHLFVDLYAVSMMFFR